MLYKFANILELECKIHTNDHLVVGVSGGPDSLCLLHVLYRLGYQITASHINHQLRPESDKEEQVVREYAGMLGVDFISREVDVRGFAEAQSVSIEEAARQLRYQTLFKLAEEYKAEAVVVGHNAEDQVETILMHMLRGAGLEGLTGMEFRSLPNPWSQTIPLVRPLLSTKRSEIQQYIAENGLKPNEDLSNLDVSYSRNRVRHELIPYLEKYNPSIQDVLLRMGQNLRDDHAMLRSLTEKAWDSVLIERGNGYIAFNTQDFIALQPSIQKYLLRKAIEVHLPGLIDVGFECIERGRALVLGEVQGKQTDLIGGLRLIKEGDRFWVADWRMELPGDEFPALPRDTVVTVEIPSSNHLNNGWVLEAELIISSDWDVTNQSGFFDPFQARLDASKLDQLLYIRARKPGDRMIPVGLNGHSVKISDVMINIKIPGRIRDTWPLVASGDEIIWMPGYRACQLVQASTNSTKVILLSLHRDRSS